MTGKKSTGTSKTQRKHEPKVRRVDLAELQPAPWNFKSEGDEEIIDRLVRSIKRARSAGVLAVRRVNGDRLEVLDGNHRLEALRRLKWEQVWVEDFGDLPDDEARLLSLRRNEQWFEKDPVKLARMLRDEIMPTIPTEEVVSVTILTEDELNAITSYAEVDWTELEFDVATRTRTVPGENIRVTGKELELWRRIVVRHNGNVEEATRNTIEVAAREFGVSLEEENTKGGD